ncbi:hypothetical protein HK104_007094 [Borealophlyctis nickersoniae]|nr:hypothetical protein HK104_007094 [Borealophlyctis nickersoniae]
MFDVHWTIKAAFYVGTAAITMGLLLLYKKQNYLIYPANLPEGSRQFVPRPSQFGMTDYEDVKITTPDGVRITGYLIRKRTGGGAAEAPEGQLRQRKTTDSGQIADCTLLYCHANAGNMGHRLPIAKGFYSRLNCNVFMLSYRGYGLSEGEPSEVGLKIDAQAALDYIVSHPELKDTKIIVYGQSIGGAVAIDLASKNEDKLAALIVENTFLSLPKLIPSVLPALRYVTFLCHQTWDSETAIKRLRHLPILLLSGSRDELVPPSHMHGLHNTIRAQRGGDARVRFAQFEDGTHNDTCMKAGYVDEVVTFWREFVEGGAEGRGGVATGGATERQMKREAEKIGTEEGPALDTL